MAAADLGGVYFSFWMNARPREPEDWLGGSLSCRHLRFLIGPAVLSRTCLTMRIQRFRQLLNYRNPLIVQERFIAVEFTISDSSFKFNEVENATD